jgi:hypothetical protein
MKARCFQEMNIMNTFSVDYHEKGTDYQDGAQLQFRDRSPWDDGKRKRQTHQIEIGSFVLREFPFVMTGRTLTAVSSQCPPRILCTVVEVDITTLSSWVVQPQDTQTAWLNSQLGDD